MENSIYIKKVYLFDLSQSNSNFLIKFAANLIDFIATI